MILLDTHALIWWVNGDPMSPRATSAMAVELEGGEIAISSITAWEIAMLTTRGRLSLSIDVTTWLAAIQQIERVKFVAIDNEIAVDAVELPGEFHKDPADRLIVATARKLRVPIVTADQKITGYPHVRTIW
jgi:PIN domain nuclease of toxin-antitoxin system